MPYGVVDGAVHFGRSMIAPTDAAMDNCFLPPLSAAPTAPPQGAIFRVHGKPLHFSRSSLLWRYYSIVPENCKIIEKSVDEWTCFVIEWLYL